MSDPHPQDEEFAQFSAELPEMSDRKFIMTILEMLTHDGSPHPNRWRWAMHVEAKARVEGKRSPESVEFCERLKALDLSSMPKISAETIAKALGISHDQP